MTDETRKSATDERQKPGTAPEDEMVFPEDAVGEGDTPQEAGSGPLELMAAEVEEWKDKYLRLAAEMDNLRRRTARDVKDAKSFSISNFARDMLGVSDNLRRALDAIPAEALEAGEAGLKALIEGVEMTERSMQSALERHGVKKLDPKDQKFDPNFHQAMFEIPNRDVPNNTVVEVVQDGYVIGDRVLRPAMVGVAKGGPKPQAESSAEQEEAR